MAQKVSDDAEEAKNDINDKNVKDAKIIKEALKFSTSENDTGRQSESSSTRIKGDISSILPSGLYDCPIRAPTPTGVTNPKPQNPGLLLEKTFQESDLQSQEHV